MLAQEVAKRLADYPLYSQEAADDQLVVMKLFHAFGAGTWYLTEYDPEKRIAFGYVTGLGGDEWGYSSIEELAGITFHGVPAIEVDLYFSPTRFSALSL